ncbi:MAG: C-terminal binding protein [Candidatus Latescibacteria bacterium]|nr:C-terminal binding protein [Candidatus Latescibacterota bacterium]
MATKILVTDYQWPDLEIEKRILGEIGAELVVAPDGEETTLTTLASGCSGILTCWAKTTARVIGAALPDLKVIVRYGIGLDNIDVDFATRSHIPVLNVPTYCVVDVAEHTLGFILALSRKIAFHDRRVRQGSWNIQDALPLRRLVGKRLGLIGLGNIGQEVAKRARAFGLEVCAYTPRLTPDRAAAAGVVALSLEELLATADFVSLHLPLTPQSSGLIGEAQLRQMKPSAFLINTSRGKLLDEEALYQALSTGRLAGAALDVRIVEPAAAGDRLIQLENVLHTPHASFFSRESIEALQDQAAWEARRVLTGQAPLNLVNPAYR